MYSYLFIFKFNAMNVFDVFCMKTLLNTPFNIMVKIIVLNENMFYINRFILYCDVIV